MTYARQLDRERAQILAVTLNAGRELPRILAERLEEIAAERARILSEFPPPRPRGRPANRKAGLDTLR